MKKLKAAIMDEIEANDIEIYQFPDCDSDEVTFCDSQFL
jgi:septin family protein